MIQKITISGKICTGKSTLFGSLQKELHWPTFSTSQLFRDYVKNHKLTLEKAEEQTKELTVLLDNQIKDFLQSHDFALVEGWMAGVKAEGMTDILKVFLTTDDHVRFARFAERERVSLQEAEEKIMTRETSWLQKLASIYNRTDFFDAAHYNCIIDTTILSSQDVLDLVLSKIKRDL